MTDDLIGKSVGGYDILDVVGRGGMATVYRAQQKSMNRVVALKVLPEQYVHDDTYIQRFNQEVEIVAKLEHRNIVPVYDYGEHESRPYIAMRYMSAGSVDDLLSNGSLEIEHIVNIIDQIAPALDYAHSKHVLHRDLKPSNVLLDDDGGAYLTDFGIARVLGETGNKGITTQGVVGTPSYMSPEQAQGQPLDNRSDIYALGIMLFELATGRRPFESDTPYSIAVMQVTTPPPSARVFNPQISFAVEEVIYKSLKKKREERYPHAVALSEALKRAMNKPISSIHDTQPGMLRPTLRPQMEAQPASNIPPPLVQQQPVYTPPPVSVHQPTPNPPPSGYMRRRRKNGNGVWMSAAIGGLVGCGLLAVLVVIAVLVLNGIANSRGTSLVPTPSAAPDNNAIIDPNSAQPTLDPTSEAARNALIPDVPTNTPGVAPVGVRDTPTLEPGIKGAGKGIVYFSERDRRYALFKLDFETGVEIQLTDGQHADTYPSVSPDGQHIAFQSDRDGDFEIYVMDIDGNNVRQITNNSVGDRLPAWSPDGQWVGFATEDATNKTVYNLYEAHPDGSELHVLFGDNTFNSHPRWSPDGRYIVYTSGSYNDAATYEIMLLDTASGGTTRLTNNNFKDSSPNFSRDGTQILFITSGPDNNANGKAAIAIMNRDGSDRRILYDGAGYETGVNYNPDGRYITFTSSSATTDQEEIFVMQADGSHIEQVTQNGGLAAWWVAG
ncbi:MAG: protein kinase [Chloroflexota bacterium]